MREVKWNKNNYKEFLKYLYSLQDLEYREFHSGLGVNKEYLIGIRTPILKKIAKEISLGNYNSFIKFNTHATYEEILIHGLIIGYIKEDFNVIVILLEEFIQYIDNWALCDLVCANLHIWNKNTENGLKFVKTALKSQNSWYNRVGVVLLLDYYINDDYIDMILEIFKDYNTNDYYVMMAVAWLLSICYIKYPNKTQKLLSAKVLNKTLQNKTIQKIRESKRVDLQTKDMLLKWRK